MNKLFISLVFCLLFLAACDESESFIITEVAKVIEEKQAVPEEVEAEEEIPEVVIDPMEDILRAYHDDLVRALDLQYRIDHTLNETLPKATTDEEAYQAISFVLEEYSAMIDAISQIYIDNTDIMRVHANLYDGHRTKYNGLIQMKLALEQRNEALYNQAIFIYNEGFIRVRQFNLDYEDLLREHNLEHLISQW